MSLFCSVRIENKLVKKFRVIKKEKFEVPMIYRNLSTDRVLTMEFCEGEHIDNKEYMIANEIDRHDVSSVV